MLFARKVFMAIHSALIHRVLKAEGLPLG